MRLKVAAVVFAVGTALVVTACTRVPDAVSPADLLGETLAVAADAVPAGASNSVQDVGQVFGAKDRFDPEEWGSSRFVVIAACSDTRNVREASRVQLGVVSVDALTDRQVSQARAGAFRGDIGCTRGFFR